jgi:hypothetical protein
LFDNVPEAFLDTNEDGVYTPDLASCSASPTGSLQCIAGQEDTFVDFNANGAYDRNDNPAVYNGLLCPLEGDGVWCSRDLVHVRALNVVTMGNGPNWDIILVRSGRVVSTSDSNNTNQVAYISDTFNNPPPGGAKVDLSTTGDCEVVGESSFDVPNIGGRGNGAFGVPVTTRIGDGGIIGDDVDPGSVIVALTSISGNYSRAFACTGLLDPLDCDFSPTPVGCPD